MFREKLMELEIWKNSNYRKPLILNGARQVGKSWLVEEFASKYYKGKLVSINFELNKELCSIFEKNLVPDRIIFELEFALNIKIDFENDLVFFDEIQFCPFAIASLRYFYEILPQLHVIAAGSLLDFEFRKFSFPVGRVSFLTLHPMTFYEFLLARGKGRLSELLDQPLEQFEDSYFSFFEEDLNLYFILGGMPAIVQNFIENNNMEEARKLQGNLITSYELDFKKYRPRVDEDCLLEVLDNAVKLIGNQAIYSKLAINFSNQTIKNGFTVLETARILHSVENVSIAGLPLTKIGKKFKIFYLDIGLMVYKSGLNVSELYLNKDIIGAYSGGLAEQFVFQQLLAARDEKLQYWAREESGASSEIDFVIAENGKIVPIEVKAGRHGSLKSLHYVLENNPIIEKAIVYSNAKKGMLGKIHFVPLIFAGRG